MSPTLSALTDAALVAAIRGAREYLRQHPEIPAPEPALRAAVVGAVLAEWDGAMADVRKVHEAMMPAALAAETFGASMVLAGIAAAKSLAPVGVEV